jgi:hypothetical protein
MTPDELRSQIVALRAELSRGPLAVRDAEIVAETALFDADLAFQKAVLAVEEADEEKKQSVAKKTALARIASAEIRKAAIKPKAELSRVKLKVNVGQSELVALQAVLKSIQIEGA